MKNNFLRPRRDILRGNLAMQLAGEPAGRIAPLDELVNTLEFEPMAQRKLDGEAFAEVSGSDRQAFDRITFRPRLMINTTKLDLTAEVMGQKMFAPIMVGPVSQLKHFHPEGELAMARGAAAAKAVMVVADRPDVPVEQIARETKATLWYQVYPEADVDAVRARAEKAVAAGCKAICLTTGAAGRWQSGWNWTDIDRFRKGLAVPLALKGILRADEALEAARRGVQGIVVSGYTGAARNAMASPIEVLPGIVDAVGGKAAVLIDGSFRRGSDVLMALALGARAVLVSRPAVWGLAAYGAAGVQRVVELLQTELGRDMGMNGRVNLAAIDRTMVKLHRW